ncbi:Alpha/Beta hydrolase protein [Podospora aff. communis PSN243]|uniref:Alpha/Beta hydrolase protein n=1 Tax=Podospora aff. communis PSN243 TaxID=3040156 RepID=A0AAV9GR73_9PEZI|nr:Alpha/Beta hydrolase protein [Podospora aff. communis PSN243]
MFTRKDKITRSLAETGEGNSQQEPPTRHSAKGVYGLKKCHDAPDAVADIVFVHGLTGNRETTWTDKATGVFWPLHLLKNDVPKARIVTFGYDADIAHFFATASQNCIRNHAINLANAVAQLRERTETEDRPIIFVTHSLGGLVFEDAMLASRNSPEAHLQKVYDSTAGVCFLGTPHCGSTLANWGTVFGQIANTVKKINTDLLRVLEPESEVLARIQGDFHAMLRSRSDQGRPPLSITCFFEELPVKGVGEIVPKHSAILPAYNSIGIYANHMDMARFTDEEDQGYLSVSTELMRWVKAIQKASAPAKPPVSAASQPAASKSPWSDNSHPNPQPAEVFPGPPNAVHYGGNHISGKIEGNTGQILQGPFHGDLTFTNNR